MRTRSSSIATATAVLLGSVVLGFGAAAPVSATSAPAVTVTSDGGIAADGPLNRVFVADHTAGTVYAADPNGTKLGSLTGIPGVSGLAVSTDGSTLYAAASASHEIVAIDAATLAVEARYPVDTNKGPTYVAFAGDKLWFSYGDQWAASLGSVDPSGTVTVGQTPQNLLWNPEALSASPTEPNLLTALTEGLSPCTVTVFDVSSGTPQTVADVTPHGGPVEIAEDVDLIPGGGLLLNGTYRMSYTQSNWTQTGAYPNTAAESGDISPHGMVAQVEGGTVRIYRPEGTQPIHTYATNAQTVDAVWAPDESRVYALEGAYSSNSGSPTSYTLKILTDPTRNVPTVSVKAPTSAPRAKKLTVTGKISATVPLTAGVKLRVTRTDLDSPKGKALPSVTTGSGGTFSFTDTPPAGGTVTYTVAYAGDATHTAVSTSAKVAVSRTTPKLTVSNNGKHYNYGKKVSYTVHLGSEYKNRTVAVYGDPYGADEGKRLLKSGKVSSAGNLSVSVTMNRNWTLSAVYAGDDRTASKTVTTHVYAYARVSSALSKQYKTAKIGSTTYAYYHKKTAPVLTTSMNYHKGRKVRLDLQLYYGGAWYTSDSEYFALASNGKVAVNLGAPGKSGLRARIRAVYVENGSGDNVNATTYGSWKYMDFTS
ncbi:Ig-like domain repeat protein [Streptomyces sp. NPDC088194]|uniref:Ig-like domain repeat protein n=1 Tax=Streptomyces sp. NPDC088194 TaxID=3154931 RepID=UPI00344CCC53